MYILVCYVCKSEGSHLVCSCKDAAAFLCHSYCCFSSLLLISLLSKKGTLLTASWSRRWTHYYDCLHRGHPSGRTPILQCQVASVTFKQSRYARHFPKISNFFPKPETWTACSLMSWQVTQTAAGSTQALTQYHLRLDVLSASSSSPSQRGHRGLRGLGGGGGEEEQEVV